MSKSILIVALRSFGVLAVVAAATSVWSVVTFGDLHAGIACLRGESLIVRPAVRDLGAVTDGQSVSSQFTITNLTGSPVMILGAEANCSCLVVSGVPATLQPSGATTLTLSWKVKRPESGGEVTADASLYLNVDHPPITLRTRAQCM